jgi:uncharacterized integral membrane protein
VSLGPGEQAAIIGVGAAVLLAVGAGIFKASSLRGDMNSKWTRRVSFAVVALDEKAFSELELLRDDLEDMLPARFDPAQAIADPAPLSQRAETTIRYYRTRTQMQRDFIRLRRVCPLLVAALAAVEIAAAGLTTYYAKLWHWSPLRIVGLVLAGLGVAVLVLTVVTYAVLQHRLASAEIRAGTGGRAYGDGAG